MSVETTDATTTADYEALGQYLRRGNRRVLVDTQKFLHRYHSPASNVFAIHREPEQSWSQDLFRRLFAPLVPPYRRFALGVFWDLVFDHAFRWLGIEDQARRDELHRALCHGEPLPQRPLPNEQGARDEQGHFARGALGQLAHHLPYIQPERDVEAWFCAASVDDGLRALDDARFRAGVGGFARLEDWPHEWPCRLLEEWWRTVTSRLAFCGAARVRRWPPPKKTMTLIGNFHRLRHNAGTAELVLNWIDLVAHQQLVTRVLPVLKKAANSKREALRSWQNSTFSQWVVSHAELLMQLDSVRLQPEIVERIRALVSTGPLYNLSSRSAWDGYVETAPARLAAASDTVLWSAQPFRTDVSAADASCGPDHVARGLTAMLHAVEPDGELYEPVHFDVKWTKKRWPALHAWWKDTWNALMAIDRTVAIG